MFYLEKVNNTNKKTKHEKEKLLLADTSTTTESVEWNHTNGAIEKSTKSKMNCEESVFFLCCIGVHWHTIHRYFAEEKAYYPNTNTNVIFVCYPFERRNFILCQ